MRRSRVRSNWDPRLETGFFGCQGSSSALSWDLIRQQQRGAGQPGPHLLPGHAPGSPGAGHAPAAAVISLIRAHASRTRTAGRGSRWRRGHDSATRPARPLRRLPSARDLFLWGPGDPLFGVTLGPGRTKAARGGSEQAVGGRQRRLQPRAFNLRTSWARRLVPLSPSQFRHRTLTNAQCRQERDTLARDAGGSAVAEAPGDPAASGRASTGAPVAL